MLARAVGARVRAAARAGGALPVHRRLAIGAGTIGSKLSGHGGIKANMVAHLDLDKIAPWSTDARSARRLAEVRDARPQLDVQRAIVAPRSADAGEMLDLVRTLKAVGVRVSILPRLLEVVGSSVVFDDLHGVTVMGVRRFELTRSSAAVKRSFDLLCTSLGLLAVAPLMLVARGGDQARQPRPGVLPPGTRRPPRPALPHLQVPHDGADAEALKDVAARPQRGPGGTVQDRRRPARDARRAAAAQDCAR